MEVVVVVPGGASTDKVAKETGNSRFGGFRFEPKLRLVSESRMHLIVLGLNLGFLEENVGLRKAFAVGLEVEMKGGEIRAFNGDEVFMFRNKGDGKKWKEEVEEDNRERNREIFKDNQRRAP